MRGNGGRVFLTRMGLHNIRVNKTMSIASVLVLISCLMLMGLVFMAAINLNEMLAQFSSRNVIMVYLSDGVTEPERESLERQIMRLENVQGCIYISSEEAYEKIAAGQDFSVLDGIQKDFMPESFEVTPLSMAEFDETVAQLEGLGSTVQRVRHFQGVARQLSALERALTIVGAAVIGVLLVVSVFIISGTVRATMYSRQQEIKVMKSVGAAPSFIRWPFLVEGVALGVVGSLAAMGLVFVLYLALAQALEPLLSSLLTGFTLVPFGQYLKYLLPGFLGVGLLTGGGGSMFSITRYLKEKVYENSELEAA
ncbi:MAG: permease-like cell division protein FtsX [Oscillospiraceae bacterium]|jgi:cell division transport system permease protein|nr:permease-like cell division protein FtsX [Oscillospiraceae bacterium]